MENGFSQKRSLFTTATADDRDCTGAHVQFLLRSSARMNLPARYTGRYRNTRVTARYVRRHLTGNVSVGL